MNYKDDTQRRRKWLSRLHSYKRLDEYGDTCPMCNRQGLPSDDFNIHHVVPVVHGGTSPPWNLIRICRSCHAVLEFGSSEDAIEMRTKAHMIQAGRYGLLYVLYFIRITGSEDGLRAVSFGLNALTRRGADIAIRQGYREIDIAHHYIV